MARNEDYAIDLNLADETRMQVLKTVLGYESAVRGLTIGQTLAVMVEEAADLAGYPGQVKERLEAIDSECRDRAARRACEAVRLPKSA